MELAAGKSHLAIARSLELSVHTVRNLQVRIAQRLGATSGHRDTVLARAAVLGVLKKGRSSPVRVYFTLPAGLYRQLSRHAHEERMTLGAAVVKVLQRGLKVGRTKGGDNGVSVGSV